MGNVSSFDGNFPDNVGTEYSLMIFVKGFEICCKSFFTKKKVFN